MTDVLWKGETIFGGTVLIRDTSRHYFGGYWRVSLTLTCDVPYDAAFEISQEDRRVLEAALGQHPSFTRSFEQMAVRADERGPVSQALLERVRLSLLPLVQSERFPTAFFRKELHALRQRKVRGVPCHH